ncbi:transmembrane protein 171-like [Spea bombifrons]|uniref:transmembrane protein 171-like n=1 Tax=Spea bombifrons TaxID=233779 RepID=UPI00234A0EA0|nr:transmembrane protein 171-like [Spea bombifrons]
MECACFGTPSPCVNSKIIFFMFVFGWVLLCGGSVLSVYGFKSCQLDNSSCEAIKMTGPLLAMIGLTHLMMAKFIARRERRRRELAGDPTDPDSRFLCGKSQRFVQFVVLGILFVACGILISIPGLLVPACKPVSNTDTTPKVCEAHSLQITALIISLIGLSFCLVAHRSRNHLVVDVSDSEEEPEVSRNQPIHVTVGDNVFIFPPPPPPYFARGHDRLMSENPPSYYSIFYKRGDHESSGHNVPQLCLLYITSTREPPPRYQAIYPTQPDPEES